MCAMARGAVNEVRISEDGVFFDGEDWPWDRVIRIRCRPLPARDAVQLSVHVRRDGLRGSLVLPVLMGGVDTATVIEELKTFLASSGRGITWQ